LFFHKKMTFNSMTPAARIRAPFGTPSTQLFYQLPATLVDAAADLCLTALKDKLGPVVGVGPMARRTLASAMNRHMCISAVSDDRLVGILGIQTAAAGFMDVTFNTLRQFYGPFGGLWRIALLALLHHCPLADEVYIDGVAVAPAYRGRGIGGKMITALEAWAVAKGMTMICLEVVDTNLRAEKLYRHLGFEAIREQTVWPFGTLFGFRSSIVMTKPLNGAAQISC
jgi:ribosomal protein S18 acetylase RimI-like enzyme